MQVRSESAIRNTCLSANCSDYWQFVGTDDDLQESIKTIQRTLDAVLALQGGAESVPVQKSRQSPTTPLHPQPIQELLGATDTHTASPIGSEGTGSADWETAGKSRHSRRMSKSAYNSPSEILEERRKNEAIAGPIVREHVHFLQRGSE